MNKKNGSLLTPTVRQELARSDQVDLLDDEAKSHHIHHVNMAAAHVTDETSRNNNLHSDRERGFLSRLKRSFTLGSTTSFADHVIRGTTNENSTTASTPAEEGLERSFLARLKRSLTATGASSGGVRRHRRSSPLANTDSTSSNGRSHGSDQFHNTMRQRDVLRSASQRVQKSTAALVKPLKKVRDSYVSCIIAVEVSPASMISIPLKFYFDLPILQRNSSQ